MIAQPSGHVNGPALPILAAASAATLLALPGCGTTASTGPATGLYVVSVERTPFFMRGPAQSSGPDFNLVKGQEVELLSRSYGFSRVKTSVEQVGYVANEDIAPAPPRPQPTPRPVPVPLESSEPVYNQSPDLPLPEEPPMPPMPVTDFRY